ncbi:MAG TPA: winged helix-turn-helix domain-containing protein [Pyrinomonadaceae bacterium]|nr:winged helix-turn-helix domain-containing protein [Pyrinomonadaceae bacterium]
MSSDTNNLYAFKDFTLDIGETVLLRHGRPVPITPKAFQLLSILVEHHGVVVEKEKLISEIWSDSIVEDGNLAFTAQLLRKVLGDDAKTPSYIETVPRKGYRFIAHVSTHADSQRETKADFELSGTLSRRGTLLISASAIAAILIVVVAWLLLGRNVIQTASARILTEPFKAERLSATGNAVQSAISPNGKLLAYTDQTGNGKWSVWLQQISTAENIQILPPSELLYGGLVFSRDSNSLFVSRGEKKLDIYRVNVFGGVPARLFENTQGWMGISPDDKKISFVRCEYSANDYCSLFVADTNGENERRLVTRPQPIRIGDSKFSADGRVIVFAVGQSRTGSDEFQLFQVDVETGMERPVNSEKFFNIKSIEWLPGGDEFLFTARPHSEQRFSIWKASLTDGSVTQLTRDDGNFSELSLDADARRLVVTKVDNNFTIYLEAVLDPSKRRIVSPGKNCTFAPDGKIVFQSNDQDIWIIDADGTNKRQLTSDPSWDVAPLVTADGRTIVFTSNRTGNYQVWRMNIDGSDQRQVTQTEGGRTAFVAADGGVIYYTADITRALKKIDVATGVESVLPEITGFDHEFSRDGYLVASFVRDGKERGELTISIQDMTGKEPIRLIGVGDKTLEPVQLEWSDDSKSLTYVIKRSGEYEVWNLDLRLDKHSLIAKLGYEPLEQVLHGPDGRSIATVRGSWLHDAFLVTGLKF